MPHEINQKEAELGALIALMRRGYKRRIPRLLRIKQSVDSGERLTDFQISYLSRVLEDATRAEAYVDHHPELQDIATKLVSLYHEITEQALKNEEAGTARVGSRPARRPDHS